MENNINKNIINATIPPNPIRGSLNNKFDSPAMADPIIKPTIKILKDNKIILNDNRLLIRSKRCKKEGASSTFKLNFRSEEHTSELQSRGHLVCRLLLEKKK